MKHDGSMSEPLPKILNQKLNSSFKDCSLDSTLTWKILGALTRDANAEDSVAENIPAEISGANPDTMLITWNQNSILKKKKKK